MKLNGIEVQNIKVNNAIGRVLSFDAVYKDKLLFSFSKPFGTNPSVEVVGFIDKVVHLPYAQKVMAQFRKDYIASVEKYNITDSYFAQISKGYFQGTVQLVAEIMYMFVMFHYKKKLGIARYNDLKKQGQVDENTCIYYFHHGQLPFIAPTIGFSSYYVAIDTMVNGVDPLLAKGITEAQRANSPMYGFGIFLADTFDFGDDISLKDFMQVYLD